MRDDRQRQDRRVPAADSPQADRQASRHDARARVDADARARGADPGGLDRSGRPHADQRRVRVRRRRHGPAGARVPQRRRRHRRHARAAAGSFPGAVRAALRPRVPGARRSGPDARHGIPARHPAHPEAYSVAPPDALLQRDDAGADCRAVARDAARPAPRRRRSASPRRCTRCRRSSSRRCSRRCSSGAT